MNENGQENELLSLTMTLWTESKQEHIPVSISECPACWKAHLADLLWKNVTDGETPMSYETQHREAICEKSIVRRLRFKRAQAA